MLPGAIPATNVPSPILLNLIVRLRRAAEYCAARRGIFRARSMTKTAMLARRNGRALKLRRLPLFHLDCARIEQVVLQVNVLIQIILIFELFWLIPLGLIGAALLLINGKQATRMEERGTAGEIMAIVGLTMTAPASYYAASGRWELTALWLWLLSALYMASSVFYIKLRVYRLNPRKQAEQRRAWRSCAVYHSFLIVALPALIFAGSLGLFAFIRIGSVREVVSRALSRLQQNGLIQIDGRRITICDGQALEVFAGG
jgi:hypothetical protein